MYTNNASVGSSREWQCGNGPSGKYAYVPRPEISGREVLWIEDIRNAPAGDNCSMEKNSDVQGSVLLVKIMAVATDQFTLYLERRSLEGNHPTLIGGIHLNASNRREDEKPTWHTVKFQLPFEKNVYVYLEKLLAGSPCPLLEVSKTNCMTSVVGARQKNTDHAYFITQGCIKEGKLHLIVDHSYPVTGFKLEFEKIEKIPKYEEVILNTELFAIADHSSQNCTCTRKGKLTSSIEIDLKKFELEKIDEIRIWGPHDTQFLGELELAISPKFEF